MFHIKSRQMVCKHYVRQLENALKKQIRSIQRKQIW